MTETETRVAILAVVVADDSSVDDLNHTLHEFSQYIIGRMGLPYKPRGIHLISVAVDAPIDVINNLAGRIGKLPGVTAKAAYSNLATVTGEQPG